jgi:hypothetical protein
LLHPNFKGRNWHSNGFTFSCTVLICLFRLPLCQNLTVKEKFKLLNVFMNCFYKNTEVIIAPNFDGQNWHTKGFSFSWTLPIWELSWYICLNFKRHKWQSKGFLCSCTVFRCFFRVLLCPNFERQSRHSSCFRFSCTVLRCVLKIFFALKWWWTTLSFKWF